MEALDLPGRGRRARRREPVRDPVAPADLVEQHLAAAAEAIGELLAVIGEHLLRRAVALQRLAERQADRAAGRALDHPREHAIARVVIHAGHDPPLAQLARSRVDQPRPVDDVQLPELHRRRPLPTHIVRALAPSRARDHQPVADQDAVDRRARRQRLRRRRRRASAHAGSAAHPTSDAPGAARRPPPRPPPTPDADTTRGRCERSPARPARRAIAPHPRMHRLARDARPRRRPRSPRAPSNTAITALIPLLDDRQRHQCQSRPPRCDRAQRGQPITAAVKHHLRLRCQASPETGQQRMRLSVSTFSTTSRSGAQLGARRQPAGSFVRRVRSSLSLPRR